MLSAWRSSLRCPVVRRVQGRDGGRRVSGARGRAGAADRSGAAPHSLTLLLSRQLPSAGYSRSSGSSRQPVKAVRKRQHRVFGRRIGELAGDLPRLLGAIEPLQSFIQERRHSVLPSVRKSSFLWARETVPPPRLLFVPSSGRVGSEPGDIAATRRHLGGAG